MGACSGSLFASVGCAQCHDTPAVPSYAAPVFAHHTCDARPPHYKQQYLSDVCSVRGILYFRAHEVVDSHPGGLQVRAAPTADFRALSSAPGLRARTVVIISAIVIGCSSSSSSSSSGNKSSPPPRLQCSARLTHGADHRRRRRQLRPSPLVCRRRLMPSAVFPVVRLPYDQPDRVARVLDEVRRELKASRRQEADAPAAISSALGPSSEWSSAAMTARVQQLQQRAREPEKITDAESTTAAAGDAPTAMTDFTALYVDQVTVGVRDCTLTPKARPEILVTTGGSLARDLYLDEQHLVPSAVQDVHDRPYLLVPPVNITAEISRPPPTALKQYDTATS